MFSSKLIRNIKPIRHFSTLENNPVGKKIFNTINPFTIGMSGFGVYCIYYVISDSYFQDQKRNNKIIQVFEDKIRN
jgi:hypothetical protein